MPVESTAISFILVVLIFHEDKTIKSCSGGIANTDFIKRWSLDIDSFSVSITKINKNNKIKKTIV